MINIAVTCEKPIMRNKYLESLVPFLMIGFVIAAVIGLIVMISYVLIWGLLIGSILWLVALVKEKFFPQPEKKKGSHKGRVIDYDDIK